MAVAGPAANLFIVILCVIFIKLGISLGVFSEPNSVGFRHIVDSNTGGTWAGISTVVRMLFTLNLVMVALNLIPFPPLDGSSIISLFLKEEAARIYSSVISNPIFGFVGFFLAWQAFSPLFSLIFQVVMNTIYWGAGFH
jgi:Zn-dependent protease